MNIEIVVCPIADMEEGFISTEDKAANISLSQTIQSKAPSKAQVCEAERGEEVRRKSQPVRGWLTRFKEKMPSPYIKVLRK